jgi:antitoxin component of MazEF toxin-antitoxin module
MKLKYVEKISPDGEVKIPEDYQKELGLFPSEEVQFRREGRHLLIERVRGKLWQIRRDQPGTP